MTTRKRKKKQFLVTFSLLCLQPRLLILEGRAPPAKPGGRACRPGCSPPRCCSAWRPTFRAVGCSRGDSLPPPPPTLPCVQRLSTQTLLHPQSHASILRGSHRHPPIFPAAAVCQPLGSAPSPRPRLAGLQRVRGSSEPSRHRLAPVHL